LKCLNIIGIIASLELLVPYHFMKIGYKLITNFNLLEEGSSAEGSQDDTSESFAFALVNGALGVFEVHGRRIRDFRC
jgi:hypothetical protein